MKKIILAGFVLFALAGCSVEPIPTESAVIIPSVNVAVGIKGFAFQPATITVKKDGKVTWTNSDTVAHSIVATDGSFGSTLLNKGQSYSFTFNTSGTFSYFCGPHPYMKGTVVVQ